MLNVLKSSQSLLKVFFDITGFIKETFNLGLYLCIISITSAYLVLNEYLHVFDWITQNYRYSIFKAVFFFILDYSAYILCCLSIYLFTQKKDFLKQKQFWLISSVIFIFEAVYRSSFIKYALDSKSMNIDMFYYLSPIINHLDSIVVIIIPLIVFYMLYEKRHLEHFFGIRQKGVDFTPYFWMFMIMAVVIFIASGQQSFLKYYPEVKRSHYIQVAQYLGISQYITLLIYEFFYMSSFIIVEVLYRGVLIFTMVRFLGKYAIYPMICVYCLLHLGKPLNEAISSFFGGFVLGVLAIQYKNIYGGIAIHMGIALLMEVFVYVRLLN
ncbi:MAG: CPBP family intramembrane metalloprotease [Saccharospirillaceae bacterium]|nr:hypothetical protein [Pseudomonadales bacterium]NRB80284.1 CPBP family intramembrane metalloprotease [Saccharospirillaceae bacterium]